MRASDFDFDLPPSQIASQPAARREEARLFVIDRATGAFEHRTVADLPSLLPAGALLVVNDTRVIPARLYGKKPTGGRIELLLLEEIAAGRWRAMAGASKPMRLGPLLLDGEDAPACDVVALGSDGLVEVALRPHARDADVLAALDRIGHVPLPPYIHREAPEAADRDRYQTVFARVPGAVAAPTAGLHFTRALLDQLPVMHAAITLHVGPGTFAPLRSDDVDAHVMHAEKYEVPQSTADAYRATRAERRPIVAVGTTVVRTLESSVSEDGVALAPGPSQTRLFIRPGYRFRAVDMLITNFHLPRSTLLMLVCAFAGRGCVLHAYQEAIRRGYRFYSYGDAMLIR